MDMVRGGDWDRDRDRGTDKGYRNTDSDIGTWTRSATERQGHDHRDWDERQEQLQRLRDMH